MGETEVRASSRRLGGWLGDTSMENVVVNHGQSVYIFVDETNPLVAMNLPAGSFMSPAVVATEIEPGFLDRYQKGDHH
jgi:hypothetical protein